MIKRVDVGIDPYDYNGLKKYKKRDDVGIVPYFLPARGNGGII